MLVHIVDLVAVTRHVDLPEHCPECGEKVSVVSETNLADAFIDGTLTALSADDVAEFEPTGSWEYGETYIVVGYRCSHCSHVLIEGEYEEVEDGS